MIRLACTADLHIGLPIARADVDRTIDAMASDIERRAYAGQRFDAIAVCGDVSHATPRPIEVLTEVRLAQRFSAVSQVIFLRGNHDPRFSLDVLRHLDGVEGPTLVIDEGADDVSVGNVEAYMAMLRRAARQIGASKVLLVTHREDIAGLADVTVEVEGGKVIVGA